MTPLLLAALLLFWAADYQAAIAQWRRQHEAALRADWSWLTVSGLHWLKPGSNTVGSGAGNHLQLPPGSPERFGVFSLEPGEIVRFNPQDPGVLLDGKILGARPVTLTPGSSILSKGPIQVLLIRRSGKLALRLKDNQSSIRRQFPGLKWFPVDPRWKIQGVWEPSPSGSTMTFDTVTGGTETMESPGFVRFTHQGKTYRLQAARYNQRLFFVFRDQTSGKTTYAACRFLYTRLASDGRVVLDFNKAENPPCAYTPHATCPLSRPAEPTPHSHSGRRDVR